MENDLMNEEKNDKVSNELPEPYIKRAKMSGNVLLVFIIITLVVLLPVDISLFVEKDYNLAIITTIILLIIVVPLFLIVYILKNKPERIIHPGEGFININSKSYKDVRNTIIQEINKIYGVDKPYMNFKVPVLYAKKYGGEVPLEQVVVYEGRDYLHFITIGIFGLCEDRGEPKFEYTFKLKKKNTENFDSEIEHTIPMLGVIAAFSSSCSELIKQYQVIPGEQGKGMDLKNESKITGFITVPDASLNFINTPNGKVDFVELVGVTDMELKSINNNQITVKELFDKIGSDITDYDRDSVI